MELSPAELSPIREFYSKSLYMQAFQATQVYGPMRDWENTSARLLGGRLAIQLGAPRLGRWLHLRAYRETPTHPEAIYYHARFRLEKFGPLGTWKFFRDHSDWNDAPPEVRADWYGLQGFVAARLHDFDRAERLLNKAESITPDRAWLCIERAACYEFAERFEDALEVTRRSLQLHPHFRPAIQAEAHLLQLLGREREALERLKETVPHVESGIIVAHLAGIQMDLCHYHDAQQSYERYAELTPLMEEEVVKWLQARRADTAYFTGDYTLVEKPAREADEPFYTDFAERFASLGERTNDLTEKKSVRLDLGDRREALITPSYEIRNLEILSRFWHVTPPTQAPMESGTYDGLPDAKERVWAEENDFIAVEFIVNAPNAHALLDRGIPFLMTMVDAGYTHSQIVLGYDQHRRSLWVRDAADYRTNEAPFRTIEERYSTTGPRGLAVVPREQWQLLEGLTLEDSAVYDLLHRLQASLLKYDRPTAAKYLEEMRSRFPEHRVTAQGAVALARHDANPASLLTALDGMLKLYPEDATFLLSKIGTLRDLGRKHERFEMAQEQVERGEKGDPLFAQHYGQILLGEPERQDEGIKVLERGIRRRPYSAGGYYILAGLYWERGRFSESCELYRFAAALDDRDEQFAEGYFRASRVVDQLPEAMRFLQSRYNRTKQKHSAPARAMFFALAAQDEMESAFLVLEQVYKNVEPLSKTTPTRQRGQRLASHDLQEIGEVMLFSAEMLANYNQPEKAREVLERAKPFAPKISWFRVAARITTVFVELEATRQHYDGLLREDPLALEVHRSMARTIADLEGREAAVSWVRDQCDRYPYFHPLQQLLIDWLRVEATPNQRIEEADPLAAPVIRRLIMQCPEDAWARRELALHLANYGRTEEALKELEEARRLEPESPSYFYTLGHVYQKADRIKESRAAYHQALTRSIDNDVAILELVNLARGEEEKEEILHQIAEEFQHQPNFGDGLLTFRDQAVSIMEPEELLKILAELNDEHPEIWQTWSTTIQQLGMLGRLDEANELVREATDRFPLLGRLWVDKADICNAQEDKEGQISALREAVSVAPGWSYAARELAEALESNQQTEDAAVVLEQAVARNPLDPVNHGYLADNLWNSGDSEEAVNRLEQALKLDPGYDWAWRALGEWAERMELGERAIDVARNVARLRPGDPRAWLALVRMLHRPEFHQEALDALDRTIHLYPRSIEAYDLKAERLAEMGRYNEARQAASPEVFDFDPPMVLQGRAAWVEAKAGNLSGAVSQMKALVAIEPNYYWGWQQLAEWHNEMGNAEEYLQAGEKLVEMRPESPVALAMRGEAKLQTGDRAGGKNDLREAQQTAPGYSFAGMLLFDAYLQDNEFANARSSLARLQEHIGGSGQPYVAARFVQLAAREGDREDALQALREVCSLHCDSTWPITTSVNEARTAGWSQDADRVLKEVWDNEDGFHPWTLLVWLDGPEGGNASPEEKLGHVEKVLAKHARFVQGHDVRAELLTRLRRFDDALAACQPEAWGDKPPLVLRGRSAWVLSMRGDKPAAISKMREILTTDRDYYWGWQQLASWYDSPETYNDYLEAGEQLVRLAPNDPTSFGYRGEAKLFLNDRRGAKSDFQRAYDLDPQYIFAGLHLIDEQLADNDMDGASKTLAKLQEHADGPYVQLRAVRVAVKFKDEGQAREAFHEMCTNSDTPVLLLHKASEAMTEAGWSNVVDEVLDEAVGEEDASSHIGRMWVERCTKRNDWKFLDRLPELLEDDEIGEEALVATLDAVSFPAKADKLYEVMKRFDEPLRESDELWSKVGEALINVGNYPTADGWLSDWRKREIEDGYLLHPAVVAARLVGKIQEAYEICDTALSLEPDSSTSDFHVWLAFEDAIAGRTEAARDHLDESDEDELSDALELLFAFADSLLTIQEADKKDRAKLFAKIKEDIKIDIEELAPKIPNPDLSSSFKRWVKRIAQDVGGLSAWWWSKRQKWKPMM
jgi:tetratricopeptide (TPR) repeat protein